MEIGFAPEMIAPIAIMPHIFSSVITIEFEAIQCARYARLDCFVALLLAMTAARERLA
jgi:hypothetical protein